MGDEIEVVLDSPKDILTVFVCQGREVDTYAGHIHALAASQCSVIFHFADQVVVMFLDHLQLQVAIVDQHIAADRQVSDKIPV